jgi:FecR protein
MRVHYRHTLPILVLSGLLTTFQFAQAAPVDAAPLPAEPLFTYPQVVRLSYVEGDVRISRGTLADKEQGKIGAKATGWEQAEANLPIESGYSLVTGEGRAEIEFEDASTVYLADNSVLSFTEITSTGGVPYTEFALIAGTATMNVRTMAKGEVFIVTTPTDTIRLPYPRRVLWRIDSYLDAVSITPLQDVTVGQPGMSVPQAQLVGQTMTFKNGKRVATTAAVDKAVSSKWDQWVGQRLESRNMAMSVAMKDAGLAAPIPGLADMNGQGKFFPCEPYGMCWEPAKGWDRHATEVADVKTPPATGSAAPSVQPAPAAETAYTVSMAELAAASKSKKTGQTAVDTYLATHPGATLWAEDYTFPCSTYGVRDLMARDPVTGREQVLWSQFAFDGDPYFAGFPLYVGYGRRGLSPFRGFDAFNGFYPWDWAVCHSGTWIRWNHHYAWVVGSERHHRPPVCWVKTGRGVGWVPIHPGDHGGKQPINAKDGIFRLTHKGESIQRVVADEGKPVKLLDGAPKEFRKPILEPLKIAGVPRAEGHSAFNPNRVAAAGAVAAGRGPAKIGGSGGSGGAAVAGGPAPARGTARVGSAPDKGLAARDPGTPITFDRRSQSFNLERPVIQGGRPSTVVEPIGGRGGNYQAGGNNGSYAARGSNSSGYSNGGGSSRSSSAAPSNGGGGSSRSSGSAPSYGGGGSRPSAPAPSYTPAPSYSGGGGGGGSSQPSAPAPSAPAPSFGGGGSSGGGSGGGASHSSSNSPK